MAVSTALSRHKSRSSSPPPSKEQQVLAHSQSNREVIQDYCPLAESLEWELGQQYFRERGNKAFIGDTIPVPFLINNDGTLSRNAAEVFFTSCVEAEKAEAEGRRQKAEGSGNAGAKKGSDPGSQGGQTLFSPDIFVLEIGIGVGLFARFFLDHFRDLCREGKKDFYDRLCYIAADRSERMLHDLLRHGVLRDHPGRYRVRVVDALEPQKHLPGDVMFRNVGQNSNSVANGQERDPGLPEQERSPIPQDGQERSPILRAVFLNYLLDCLPAAVLEFKDDQVNQLCVRTCLARNIKLAEHTDMSAEALRQRAKACSGNGDGPSKPSGSVPGSEKARDDLMEVYHLFASEYDYRPAKPNQIPYGEFAVDFGKRHGKRLMHNYGAIQCVERLLDLVHPSGFILMNEYGMNKVGRDDEYEHQRFSMATAVGLNFPLLMTYFQESKTGKRTQNADSADSRGENQPVDANLRSSAKSAFDSAATGQERSPIPHRLRWAVPVASETRGIETRLLGHQPADDTVMKFHEVFNRHVQKELEEPVQQARASLQAGRFEMAANFYQKALEKQPRNWFLMGEISAYLTFQTGPKKGSDPRSQVGQTPSDARPEGGHRHGQARPGPEPDVLGRAVEHAGRRSVRIRPHRGGPLGVSEGHGGQPQRRAGPPQPGVGLRCSEKGVRPPKPSGSDPFFDEKALQMVGEALAHDKTGQLRERLLHKQNEILALAARQHQQEYLLYVNFVSRDPKKHLGTATEAAPAPPMRPEIWN